MHIALCGREDGPGPLGDFQKFRADSAREGSVSEGKGGPPQCGRACAHGGECPFQGS